MLSERDIQKIRDRRSRTTREGAWEQSQYEHGGSRIYVEDDSERLLVADTYQEGDRESFLHAPGDIDDLIAETERLKGAFS